MMRPAREASANMPLQADRRAALAPEGQGRQGGNGSGYRSDARRVMFARHEDFAAFERVLAEAVQRWAGANTIGVECAR